MGQLTAFVLEGIIARGLLMAIWGWVSGNRPLMRRGITISGVALAVMAVILAVIMGGFFLGYLH